MKLRKQLSLVAISSLVLGTALSFAPAQAQTGEIELDQTKVSASSISRLKQGKSNSIKLKFRRSQFQGADFIILS